MLIIYAHNAGRTRCSNTQQRIADLHDCHQAEIHLKINAHLLFIEDERYTHDATSVHPPFCGTSLRVQGHTLCCNGHPAVP